MANRLLPFRQYNEHFVINLFALKTDELTLNDVTKNTHKASGSHDAGLIVKLDTATDLGAGYGGSGANAGKGNTDLNAYMGSTDYPHVGRNVNPEAFGKFTIHGGLTAKPIGITLNQTLAYDENGEKMLYYRQKLLEHQGVLPGEAVPILTKGIITVSSKGFATGTYTPGNPVYVGGDGDEGKFVDGPAANAYADPIGTVIATGDRDGVYDAKQEDYFAGDGSSSEGAYLIINLDL
jgi:hypothetical protein